MANKKIEIKASGAVIPSDTATAEVLNRTYYSTYHLWAAKHFVKLAGEIENDYAGKDILSPAHRAYVTNAILSGVAFMEAAINELFQDIFEGHSDTSKTLGHDMQIKMKVLWDLEEEDKVRGVTTLEKYNLALRYAGK